MAESRVFSGLEDYDPDYSWVISPPDGHRCRTQDGAGRFCAAPPVVFVVAECPAGHRCEIDMCERHARWIAASVARCEVCPDRPSVRVVQMIA